MSLGSTSIVILFVCPIVKKALYIRKEKISIKMDENIRKKTVMYLLECSRVFLLSSTVGSEDKYHEALEH